MKENSVKDDVKEIKKSLSSPEDLKRLMKLESLAHNAESYQYLGSRIIGGLSVGPAVEKWLEKVTPKKDKTFIEYIPKHETVEVVAAVVRQSYYRTISSAFITVVISSAVTVVTAYFLNS